MECPSLCAVRKMGEFSLFVSIFCFPVDGISAPLVNVETKPRMARRNLPGT